MFLVCVAANNVTSLNNVRKWTNEIRQVCPDTPILLIRTKQDLLEHLEEADLVTDAMIEKKCREEALQGSESTSSKEWHDFNVHKAFVKAISTGYYNKYDEDI